MMQRQIRALIHVHRKAQPWSCLFSAPAPHFLGFNGNLCRLIKVQVSSLETLSRTLPEVHPAMHHRRTASGSAGSLATIGMVHILLDVCAV